MLGKKVDKNEAGGAEHMETGNEESIAKSTIVSRLKKRKKPRTKKSKKKKIIIGVVILALIGLGVTYKLSAPKEAVGMPVSTGTAEKMDIEQVVTIKGVVEGSEKADIASNVNYKVISIGVSEGGKVSKGQVLATLDGGTAQADYNKAVKTLEQSKFEYDAAQSLFDQGAVSREELLKAKTAFENDSITVSSYKGLEDTQIVSPISGTVTRVNTSIGRAANDTKDKEAMFVVEDLANLQMKVKVSEYDIGKIKIGQGVTITADILGKNSVTGVVSKISPTGEPKDASSKERVIPVTIDVEKGNTSLIAGVSAKAKILIEKKTGVLTVPIDAILGNPGEKNYVFVLHGNNLKKVPVIVGTEGTLNVEVSSDQLKAGDQVVLGPTFEMKNGMVVNPMPQQ